MTVYGIATGCQSTYWQVYWQINQGLDQQKKSAYEDDAVNTPPLRFKIGQAVQCRFEERWSKGTIVKIWYREDHWPASHFEPYQIQLEDGTLIAAPLDEDCSIREPRGQQCDEDAEDLKWYILTSLGTEIGPFPAMMLRWEITQGPIDGVHMFFKAELPICFHAWKKYLRLGICYPDIRNAFVGPPAVESWMFHFGGIDVPENLREDP